MGLPITEATIPGARDLVERVARPNDPELRVEDDERAAQRLEHGLERPETEAFRNVRRQGSPGFPSERIIRPRFPARTAF